MLDWWLRKVILPLCNLFCMILRRMRSETYSMGTVKGLPCHLDCQRVNQLPLFKWWNTLMFQGIGTSWPSTYQILCEDNYYLIPIAFMYSRMKHVVMENTENKLFRLITFLNDWTRSAMEDSILFYFLFIIWMSKLISITLAWYYAIFHLKKFCLIMFSYLICYFF